MEYFLEDLLGVDPSRIGLKELTPSSKLNQSEISNRGVKEQNLEKRTLVVKLVWVSFEI